VPFGARVANSQTPTTAQASASFPEPIYWRQHLLLIPYQWESAAGPSAARAVWLFVSKDRGATWQKISDAQPHVKSFNYRADGEGEYWFAIQTVDHQGRALPAGPHQPELRVVVDTTIPRIDQLTASRSGDGTIYIQWSGSDAHLDPSSWRIEAQRGDSVIWEHVPLAIASNTITTAPLQPATQGFAGERHAGQTAWTPAPGAPPVAIRATVADHAGNTATFRTEIQTALTNGAVFRRLPSVDPTAATPAFRFAANTTVPLQNSTTDTAPTEPNIGPATGWISSSATFEAQQNANQQFSSQAVTTEGGVPSADRFPQAAPSLEQPWLPTVVSHAPFRLSTSGLVASDDRVTVYGEPTGADHTSAQTPPASISNEASPPARYAMNGQSHEQFPVAVAPQIEDERPFSPLQPYREIAGAPVDSPQPVSQITPDVAPKLVGSRSFALEYDLEESGRWGVTKVEVWGTPDGGQSWRRFAQDDDNLSPLIVSVDEEGLYGFRIIVESTQAPAVPPTSGDTPELWVAVDLQRPIAELTAIEPGAANLADHLVLRWRAADDNLEPRPIALFYSSRPAGPWSAIATNLKNTGEYVWRVERHVPSRFYVRLEARDTAGNLSAFQTREPIEFNAPAPVVHLRDAEPLQPTATGGTPSYR
jgi:hypothetical protein